MSVLEDLRSFEQRVVERLSELQPLVKEYEELQRVAARMGIETSVPAKRSAAKPAKRASAGQTTSKRSSRATTKGAASRSRSGGTRATGAERRTLIIQMVSERPGITVSEISKALGVDPPPLYRVVRKLLADGVIKKEGAALRPA